MSFIMIMSCATTFGQAYRGLNIVSPEYNMHESSVGIYVRAVIYDQSMDTYRVYFVNANHNDTDCITTYSFDWYLSYNGKRVSDYYKSVIKCQEGDIRCVKTWVKAVPLGNESYVSVQFGREVYKDRRDDD